MQPATHAATPYGRLLLVTQGRYSQRPERQTLPFISHGDDFLIVHQGADPDWLLDLKEEPVATVELPNQSHYVRAKFLNALERLRLQVLVAATISGVDTTKPDTTTVLLKRFG